MNTLRYFRYVAIGLFLITSASLIAEVEEVVIKWNPGLCQDSCLRGLEERFKKIPGVASVEMNQPNGMATIQWKKRVPFSFQPLNYALRFIGIRQNDVHVKVRGNIAIYRDIYSIISTEDHTRFELFDRVSSSPTNYVVLFNPANRVLSPQLKQQLDEIKQHNQTVVIEGSLFMPLRSPPDPLRLIIGQLKVEEPNAQKQPAGQKQPDERTLRY